MSRSTIALPLVALLVSLIACFSDSDEPADPVEEVDMNNEREGSLLLATGGYDSFLGLGGGLITPGVVLPIDLVAGPVNGAEIPVDVTATSDDPAIAEVVRITARRVYATAEQPERMVPVVEVRSKAVGETLIKVNARYMGQAVSAQYRVTVGVPEYTNLYPWCIERDSGTGLSSRAALPGERIWFRVESLSPGENPTNVKFYVGQRDDALIVTPPAAATVVPDDSYTFHYGLRVEPGATEFTIQSAPNTQSAAADYKVVSEADITEIKIAAGTATFGVMRGSVSFLSWSSSTEDRYLCGQGEEATIKVITPALCDAELVVGEVAVRDAMSSGIFNFWRQWHPQKAIRVEAKAAGDCVIELDTPKVNGGQGIKTPITIPIQ